MSAAAKPEKTKKDLSGLMPYLKRYKSGIVIGLVSVVLMPAPPAPSGLEPSLV